MGKSHNKSESKYIRPYLHEYGTAREVIDKEKTRFYGARRLSWEEILSKTKTAVLGEPGFGKSRFLRELVKNTNNAICIDLKTIQDKTILDLIEENICLESNNFDLENLEESIICFDALDEVKGDDFLSVVDKINVFIQDNPKVKIFVSCRIHHFEKWNPDIAFDSFLSIAPLDSQGIYEFLKCSQIRDEDLNKVWKKYRSSHSNSIIQTPRYLEMLLDVLKEKGVDHVLKLTKISLFDELVFRNLSIEAEKSSLSTNQDNIFISRVQQTLALIMEINQSNLITEDEFWTIVDDIQSKIFTVQAIQRIPKFWERTLIKKNANNEIEFQNTEIQEYLAAREISRLGNLEQSIFDFAFEPLLREIMPSWYNTLSFLIDLNPSLLISLLDFVNGGNQKIIHSEDLFKLIKIGSDNFSDREKTNIFQLIFTYFQNNNIWIPFEIEDALPSYYTPLNEELLKTSIDGTKSKGIYLEVKRGNTASIVEGLVRRNKLNNEQLNFWNNKFQKWLKENRTSDNSAFLRYTLRALTSFKDINLLKEVHETYESGDDLYKQVFIEGCAEIDPDNDLSIEYFEKALFSSSTSMLDYHARESIAKLNKKESVVKILVKCVTDRDFLIQFGSQFDDNWNKKLDHNLEQFLDKVDKFWDSKISKILNNIVIEVYSRERIWELRDGKFIFYLLDLLKKYNENYLFQLMNEISSLDIKNSNYYQVVSCFAHLLEEKQTEEFIENFKVLFSNSYLLSVFFRVENYYPNKQSIVEKAKKILVKEYQENKKQYLEQEKIYGYNNNKEVSVYEEFRFKLEPESNKYMSDLFYYFFNNKDKLRIFITPKEKKRIEELIENIINRSPKEASLEITNRKENGSTYTVTTWVQEFTACVNLLSECEDYFNINIAKYRNNIIQILPFSYTDTVRNVFALLGDYISKEEIDSLMEVYDPSRKDDLKIHLPSSLIEAVKKYRIAEAVPILQFLIDQSKLKISHYHKIEALNVLGTILHNKEYFVEIFDSYININDEEFEIAEEANRQLIIKFKDESAINWRFDQLKKRVIEFERPKSKGVRRVSSVEAELSNKTFGGVLFEISDPDLRLYMKFEHLLDFAVKISERNKKMELYAQYLREIYSVYIGNLKINRNYIPIDRFEKWILKNETKNGVNWLKYKLFEAKRNYMIHLSKPQSIREAVSKYNIQKRKHYIALKSSVDLVNVAEEIINIDIERWVNSEGGYRMFHDFDLIKKNKDNEKEKGKTKPKAHEEFIQKTIKAQFELGFLRREFREADLNVIREPQLLNDKKPDFIISYGLSGKIIIEIKLSDNNEVKLKVDGDYYKSCIDYKEKILKYPKGFGAIKGIFLIVNLKKRDDFKFQINKLKKLYDETHIKVIGLDCSI